MKLSELFRALDPTRWAMLAGAVALLIIAVLTLSYCSEARRHAADAERARSGTVVAEGGQAAAVDALGASEKAADARAASDQLTGANRDEILSTPGADASVGHVSDAGLRSLCRRPSYVDSPRCRAMRAAGS